jgi:hypothetical protein
MVHTQSRTKKVTKTTNPWWTIFNPYNWHLGKKVTSTERVNPGYKTELQERKDAENNLSRSRW